MLTAEQCKATLLLSNAIAKQCWCYRVVLKPIGPQNREKLNKNKKNLPKPVPRAAAAYGGQLKITFHELL